MCERRHVVLIVLSLCLFAGGCSAFDRDWEAMTESPPPPPGSVMEWRWEGKWLSSVNEHTGGLRCIVTREESFTDA